MAVLSSLLAAGVTLPARAGSESDRQTVIVVVGAEGEPDYGRQFQTWAARWQAAARQADAAFVSIGGDSTGGKTDHDVLRETLALEHASSRDTLWLILIGHGTFDGRVARFNLRGPDLAAGELAIWLEPMTRPLVVVNCTSSSAPFLPALSRANTVVITATRSGQERSFSRFGEMISAAISDTTADLDKDEQTSALEAFLIAAARVENYYEEQSRLMTEHALIDDNGDKQGTPAGFFQGTRVVKTAEGGAAADGVRANQLSLIRTGFERTLSPEVRQRRDTLETELASLRTAKPALEEAVYYERLEEILRTLADLYEKHDQAQQQQQQNTETKPAPAAPSG